jgi:hypothetical protein
MRLSEHPTLMGLFLIIAPACMAIVGIILVFNVRGMSDYLYLRFSERLAAVGGGISPRTLRLFGALFAFLGTIGFAVEVVSRVSS